MSSEQRYLLRNLALLLKRYYRECASAARFPIDSDIFGIGLYDVRIPGILADPQVIVALFSSSGATENVSYASSSAHCCGLRMVELKGLRYFDALTNRPDIEDTAVEG